MEREEDRPAHRPRASILLPVESPGEVEAGMVERIIRALYEDPGMREVLAPPTDPAAPAYATLSESGGLAPAEGVPLLIPEIGVLTVPMPAEGTQAIEELIRGVAPEARVEGPGTYSKSDAGPPGGE